MEPGERARVGRRLAAIFGGRYGGYSRLIGADEEGTPDPLNALRAKVIDPKIAGHRGRLVKAIGDGLLVGFSSVIDAGALRGRVAATKGCLYPRCLDDRRCLRAND